ncbi:YbaK/EbsC family protein [Marinisporobacter balticus]|uniref:Prolyl-tRNA editing enzyme YbaK/EbsC (Cys-tRNA(Pro) deacylase) n=1 Tax=Marinisporobacter balticus TaxID=2018667 RepID=A0A4R2KN09_9FIRM|nr:YbaK/EbsC family protein [Marinisporobacter balticus]TCO74844.1 prolyl-tRNA editing enzyme YbaK/EbsC (Cys-tRNA(Pro) deacylase) [Marinisporobacter balticus]
MSIESVKRQFKEQNLDLVITELDESSATVALAANAIGVEPDRIAKTMAFRLADKDILVISKGTARIDNRKYKDYFKTKVKMLKAHEVLEITGHPVGGVCPFGLKNKLEIYLDKTLDSFDHVYPAGGSPNSAVKITVEKLEEVTNGTWIDVCK